MDKRQFARVQHHARRGVVGQLLEPDILSRAVSVVADERMADELKMHADLMRASGVNLRLHQRRPVKPFENLVARVRRATGTVVVHSHAFAMRRTPRDGGADFSRVARRLATHERMVNLIYLAFGKLFRQRNVCLIVLGDDEAAAGFLVEPVDDARSRHAAGSSTCCLGSCVVR